MMNYLKSNDFYQVHYRSEVYKHVIGSVVFEENSNDIPGGSVLVKSLLLGEF